MSDEAWIYDLASGHIVEDFTYWARLLQEHRPKRVLELGCRTGRLSFHLVTTGLSLRSDFNLLSLDGSAAMLDRARARLISNYPAAAPSLRFVLSEVTSVALGERFDLIVVPAGVLETIVELEQQRRCLQAIRKHLAEGGRLAFDLRAPCLTHLAEAQLGDASVVRQELDRLGPAPGVARFLTFSRTIGYDAVTQTEQTSQRSEIFYADGRRQSLVNEASIHRYFPNELRLLLASSGFAPIAQYGSYDLEPFAAASRRYLWVMSAA